MDGTELLCIGARCNLAEEDSGGNRSRHLHGPRPQLNTTPEEWELRLPADRKRRHWFKGKQYDFDELIELRHDENLGAESAIEAMQVRSTPARKPWGVSRKPGGKSAPTSASSSATISGECFHEDITPMSRWSAARRSIMAPDRRTGAAPASPAFCNPNGPTGPRTVTYPGLPELANRVMEEGHRSRFDLSLVIALAA